MKSSNFTLSSKTQYNTSIVSLISLEFILFTHTKNNSLASYLLQQYLHYAPVWVRKGSCKNEKSSCILELDFCSTLGNKKRKAHIHTLSSKFHSPEQSSQANSQRVSDTRLILFWNHTGELVITASSRVRPQATDILVLQKQQERYLTRYTGGVPVPTCLKITCGRAGQKCNQILNTYLRFGWWVFFNLL